MRDAEELWGKPRGNGKNEGEFRGCEGARELLKSWGQYLGELWRHNLGVPSPPHPRPTAFLGKEKGETLTFAMYERGSESDVLHKYKIS